MFSITSIKILQNAYIAVCHQCQNCLVDLACPAQTITAYEIRDGCHTLLKVFLLLHYFCAMISLLNLTLKGLRRKIRAQGYTAIVTQDEIALSIESYMYYGETSLGGGCESAHAPQKSSQQEVFSFRLSILCRYRDVVEVACLSLPQLQGEIFTPLRPYMNTRRPSRRRIE